MMKFNWINFITSIFTFFILGGILSFYIGIFPNPITAQYVILMVLFFVVYQLLAAWISPGWLWIANDNNLTVVTRKDRSISVMSNIKANGDVVIGDVIINDDEVVVGKATIDGKPIEEPCSYCGTGGENCKNCGAPKTSH